MTVEELIKLLKEMPQDATVVVMDSEGLYRPISLEDISQGVKLVWIG